MVRDNPALRLAALALVGLLVVSTSTVAWAQQGDDLAPEEKMDEKDAYEILGLGKRATEAEIRKSFKEKSLVSRKHHATPLRWLCLSVF